MLKRWLLKMLAVWSVFFKQEARAEEIWKKILALDLAAKKNPGRVYGTLAHFAASRGDREAAMSLLEHSIAADSGLSSSWFNLGFLLQEKQDHDRALTHFERAIALDEKNDRAYYGKAISLIKLGRLNEAITALKTNIALQPMSPFGFYQLAHVHLRLGDSRNAEIMIRQVSRFEPQVARQLERETGILVFPQA
jgi:tetratricopeptide (TPR) repeat protein